MAIYHFTAKAISMGNGESAVHRAAYHARTQLEDERNGKTTRDYAHKGDLAWTGIFAPKDAPDWTHDRNQLWNRAEKAERQANGQPARNIEFALPNELTREQQIRLLTDFAREQFARKGMVADVAIHSDYDAAGQRRAGVRDDEPRNDHVHMMLTMRRLDGDRFSKTKTDAREWNSKQQLNDWRAQWAKHGANALQKAGFEIEAARFAAGHMTLPEQRKDALTRGDIVWAAHLDREPDVKQGAVVAQMEARGQDTERGEDRRALQDRNAERDAIRKQAIIIDFDLARLDRRQAAEKRRRPDPAQAKAAKAAADRIKAANDARYRALRARHEAGYQRRAAEIETARRDREEARGAIYAKYQTAFDGLWKPGADGAGAGHTADPDRSAWQQINQHLANRKTVFDDREQSLLGRLENARRYASRGTGLFGIVRLALNADKRRTLFERDQRRTTAQLAPVRTAGAKAPVRPATPAPARVRSEQLKVMRAAELASFDQKQRAGAAAMQARHQFERQAEAAERDSHKRDSAAAWDAHREAFPLPGERRLSERRPSERGAFARQVLERGGSERDANEAAANPPDLPAGAPEAETGHETTPAVPEATQQAAAGQGEGIVAEDQDNVPLTAEEARQARLDALRQYMETRDRDDRHPGRERYRTDP